MSTLALARKYRPATFEDLVGQEAIARTLQGAIAADRVSHAYLLAGPRGVGKTTVARILARALNCERGPTDHPQADCDCAICPAVLAGRDLDFIEIDGASNRGIDEIRDIRDNVRYRPARARFKIYLIDEVHMLTTPAFNALLKTLEEPPPHVVFLFATTEAHKLPETIRSRCQRFDFRRITPAQIAAQLERVCRAEGIEAEPAAIAELARAARGALRDALVRLDQVRAWCAEADGRAGPVTATAVHQVLGTLSVSELTGWAADLFRGDVPALFARIEALYNAGADLEAFLEQWVEMLRDLLVVSRCGAREDLLLLAQPGEPLEALARASSGDALLGLVGLFVDTASKLRQASLPRVLLEVAFTRAALWDAWIPAEQIAQALSGHPPPARAEGPAEAVRPAPSAPLPAAPQPARRTPQSSRPAPRAEAEAPGPVVAAEPAPSTPRPPRAESPAQSTPPTPRAESPPAQSTPPAPPTGPSAASRAPGVPPPPAPSSAAPDPAGLAAAWRAALDALDGQLTLELPLLRRARPTLSGQRVFVQLGDADDRFLATKLQHNAAKLATLTQALSAALGAPCSVEISLADGPRPTAEPRRTAQQVSQDPYVRAVLDVFGGQVLEVRPPEDGRRSDP